MKADVSIGIFLSGETKLFARHVKLLKAVEETKSITKAAEKIGVSYKTAWDTLDMLNNKSQQPLLQRIDGGKKNSGTRLSEYAKTLIAAFDNLLLIQQDFLERVLDGKIELDSVSRLRSLGLALSARNQIRAEVSKIEEDTFLSDIYISLSPTCTLVASITTSSKNALNLQVGTRVVAIFKSPSVKVLTKASNAQNEIKAQLLNLNENGSFAELLFSIGDDLNISATISTSDLAKLKEADSFYLVIDKSDIIIGV